MQEGAQLGIEGGAAVGRESRVVCAGGCVCGQKLALHFEEVREGDAAALLGCCDHYEAQGCVGAGLAAAAMLVGGRACWRVRNVVYEQAFMGVGELLGLVVGDLGEDDGC